MAQPVSDHETRSALQPVGWVSGGLPDVAWDRSGYPGMQGEAFDEPFGGVDLLLDLPDECDSEAKPSVPDVCAAGSDEANTVESDSHVAGDQFAALRLLDGAREIAQEVLKSIDDALRGKAKALVARLDVLESAQHAKSLVHDAL